MNAIVHHHFANHSQHNHHPVVVDNVRLTTRTLIIEAVMNKKNEKCKRNTMSKFIFVGGT